MNAYLKYFGHFQDDQYVEIRHNFTTRADMITVVPGASSPAQKKPLTFPNNTYGDWYIANKSMISYIG